MTGKNDRLRHIFDGIVVDAIINVRTGDVHHETVRRDNQMNGRPRRVRGVALDPVLDGRLAVLVRNTGEHKATGKTGKAVEAESYVD